MKRNHLKFSEAKEYLREGDILLFRGTGIVSFFIKRASEGKYSHVGVASSHGRGDDKMWECVEFREGKGGRTVNLEQYVRTHNGIIDVYRPKSEIKKSIFEKHGDKWEYKENRFAFDGKCVTNIMRRLTGLPYGWRRIWWMATNKLPFLRIFMDIQSVASDKPQDIVYPVCSTAVAYSFSRCNYDLVHNRASNWTEPSDIARSSLIHYLFTLDADSGKPKCCWFTGCTHD